jgi:broad specificity phosphatase PhoE
MTSPALLTPTPFWFLRHGETDWNAANLSQGNVDIPLNATGLAQAGSAAEKLMGKGIATIVCSPLSRARVTADYAGKALGLPIAVDDGLREVAFGVQEGQPMSEWFVHWIEGQLTPEKAETFADLRERAVTAINRCILLPAPVLVVAHGALFRAIRQAMGLEPNFRTPNAVPILCQPPGSGETAWTLHPTT